MSLYLLYTITLMTKKISITECYLKRHTLKRFHMLFITDMYNGLERISYMPIIIDSISESDKMN